MFLISILVEIPVTERIRDRTSPNVAHLTNVPQLSLLLDVQNDSNSQQEF